ncbi:hypothetical protein ACF07F_34810 [Streptomyces sp. NPDC015237]|uniref:hypothetical protein n=1 Tax=Streptomyces sp. NPDC015237 TaxID=3364949 RepID=UPI0036F4BAF0
MLRTYVSRLRRTLEPGRAADESRAVIVSHRDRSGSTSAIAITDGPCESIALLDHRL